MGGLIKIPTNITIPNVQQFGLDTAMAIQQYKITTNRAHL